MSFPPLSSANRASSPRAFVSPSLGPSADDWNRVALQSGNPFMTHEWLTAWWGAFGHGEPTWFMLKREDDSLEAGAFLARRGRSLIAAANVHSGEWDVAAGGEDARRRLWEALIAARVDRIRAPAIPNWSDSATVAARCLTRAGYRVFTQPGPSSPWLELPASWDELLAVASRGLRSQVGRRRRALEREGELLLRVTTGGPTLDRDLESFLTLEAAGWKGRNGTAIASSQKTRALYAEFAHAAAARGWLRLYRLELDGEMIAGDYACAVAGAGSLIKTAFSEAHSRLSPGLVLRAAVLRDSIEQGLHCYYFHGQADPYKLRWTSDLRPHADIWAYRRAFLPGYAYRSKVRPKLRAVRDAMWRGGRRR